MSKLNICRIDDFSREGLRHLILPSEYLEHFGNQRKQTHLRIGALKLDRKKIDLESLVQLFSCVTDLTYLMLGGDLATSWVAGIISQNYHIIRSLSFEDHPKAKGMSDLPMLRELLLQSAGTGIQGRFLVSRRNYERYGWRRLRD